MNQKALLTKGFLALIAEFAVFAALVFGSDRHSALARRMSVLGDLLRRRSGDGTLADPRSSRTPGKEHHLIRKPGLVR